MPLDDALIGVDVDDVAHVHVVHVHLERKGARVLHRVEEDGRDLGSDADAARALVRHHGDVIAHVPEDGVGGRLSRRAGADDVANVGEREARLGVELVDLLLGVGDALARVLEHRQSVERDVWSRPGVRSRRQVVCVRLTHNLEDRDGHLLRNLRLGHKPLGVSPGLDNLLGCLVTIRTLVMHIVLSIENERELGKCFYGRIRELGVVESINQRLDVISPHHGAQKLHSMNL
mmetsp:Transcript_19096/g.41260  ORF Transcript_19096/g.41260 Transcript_19096/m.41260 type:complete len:232 (+) Transcript_19096:622-1317(+)